MRKSCEQIEVEISAMVDCELPVAETLEVIDHLLTCSECRELYSLTRGLDQALGQAKVSARAGELPAGLWSRIDSAVAAESKVVKLTRKVRRSPRTWLLSAAAALVIVMIGAWFTSQGVTSQQPTTDNVLLVALESDQGAMTEERFIELTTELLRSERRYHRSMLEIMVALEKYSRADEGRPDLRLPRSVLDDNIALTISNELEPPEEVIPERT
jgi:predicted anti-sigma-YlaC factor YlaD